MWRAGSPIAVVPGQLWRRCSIVSPVLQRARLPASSVRRGCTARVMCQVSARDMHAHEQAHSWLFDSSPGRPRASARK
jgi:hypothetical protein